jgi:predicted metal-dependent hydrolase
LLVAHVPARADVRPALRAWYRRRAAAYLPARARHWAAKLEVTPPPLLIREPPKRWGSCDASGTVRLNWRVTQVAPRLIDYVVAHELVHLEHPRHDADFWSRLGRVMPDAEARRGKLRRAGVRVGW